MIGREKNARTRREFMADAMRISGAIGLSLFAPGTVSCDDGERGGAEAPGEKKTTGRSRVVVCRSDAVFKDDGSHDDAVVRKMVLAAVRNLVVEDDDERAWKKLFSSDDVVGIKVNSIGRRLISPKPVAVGAIVEGLRLVGIPDERIVVWDRTTEELRDAGYTINTSRKGVKCFGTDAVGYDSNIETKGSIGSFFSRIVSDMVSALVSVPIFKDHDYAGVSLSLKNFYGAIQNPNKYHENNCDPCIADLNSHHFIANKLRLVVSDALAIQYHGGPGYKPKWSWKYGGILAATDPVAHDRVGADIIEEKRAEEGLKPLSEEGRPVKHIASAARLGLGIDDRERIERLEISV